jgi:hypothetical protein
MRPPIGGPIRRWHMPRHEIAENVEFVAECVRLWDEGKDTKDISLIMLQPEYVVETAVRMGREHRRRTEAGQC